MSWIEHAATIVECWIYANFLIRFLGIKTEPNVIYTYTAMILVNFIITSVFNHFMLFEGQLGIIRIIANIVLSTVLLKGTWFDKIFSSVIADTSVLLINYITMNTLCRVFFMDMTQLASSTGFQRLMTLFITKFLFFILTRILIKIKQKERYLFSKLEWITLTAVFMITLFVEMEIFRMAYQFDMAMESASAIGAGAGLISVNVLVSFLMRQISKKNQENASLLMDKMQMEVYENQLSDFETQYEEMKQIRHDMKNHIQYISALIQNNSISEAQKYLEDMVNNQMNFGYAGVKTGNRAVDVIANAKLSVCSSNHIRTVISIGSFTLAMDDVDICAVLGNLFDNAIEACSQVAREKFLYFEMVQNKGYVHLVMKNSIV